MIRIRTVSCIALFLVPSALSAQQNDAQPARKQPSPAVAPALQENARMCKLAQRALQAALAVSDKDEQTPAANNNPAVQPPNKTRDDAQKVAAPIKC